METLNREALLVIDYQNDFANPNNGTLYVRWWELLVPYINSLMSDIKRKSWIIITSQDWHPENHISFAKTHWLPDFSELKWETKWPVHCVANSFWADFMEWFDRDLVDRKVLKWYEKDSDSYSSFGWIELLTDSDKKPTLDEILKSYWTKVINIVWLATDYCVKATVLDALKLWYDVKVDTKWISAVNVNPCDWEKAIKEMKNAWAIILT